MGSSPSLEPLVGLARLQSGDCTMMNPTSRGLVLLDDADRLSMVYGDTLRRCRSVGFSPETSCRSHAVKNVYNTYSHHLIPSIPNIRIAIADVAGMKLLALQCPTLVHPPLCAAPTRCSSTNARSCTLRASTHTQRCTRALLRWATCLSVTSDV